MAAQLLLDSPPPDAPLHLSATEPTLELCSPFHYLPLRPLAGISFTRNMLNVLFAAVGLRAYDLRAYGSATAATEYASRRREQHCSVRCNVCSVDAVASAVAMDCLPSVSRFISLIQFVRLISLSTSMAMLVARSGFLYRGFRRCFTEAMHCSALATRCILILCPFFTVAMHTSQRNACGFCRCAAVAMCRLPCSRRRDQWIYPVAAVTLP